MRALTLIQPMGWALAAGYKPVENRGQDLPGWMRGRPTVVAIHGGRKYDAGYEEFILDLLGWGELPGESGDTGILGVARFTGYVVTTQTTVPDERLARGAGDLTDDQLRWFFGPYGYVIDDAFKLRTPIACRGMLGFWRLDGDTQSRLLSALPLQWVERIRAQEAG